jgi:hypothetical protein
MKTFETKINDSGPVERFSRRLENGVEIIEHETVATIKMHGDRYETVSPRRSPRLVVEDAVSATRNIISKTRSEIAGLDNILRGSRKAAAG